MKADTFKFKQFTIRQDKCTMKVNTDGVLLGSWTDLKNKRHSLDIGTGTGVIAIMIAQRNVNILSHGIEIDKDAYEQATENMGNSPYSVRLKCIHQSIQAHAREAINKYDLIVSNPPFFSGGTFSLNENKASVRHTIKLPHTDLLNSVRNLLTDDGNFDVILPYIEGLRFIELAGKYDFGVKRITEVIPRTSKSIERLLIRFEMKYKDECITDQLIVHEGNQANQYTDVFLNLTRDFYLFID